MIFDLIQKLRDFDRIASAFRALCPAKEDLRGMAIEAYKKGKISASDVHYIFAALDGWRKSIKTNPPPR